jgi:hypothetical protein
VLAQILGGFVGIPLELHKSIVANSTCFCRIVATDPDHNPAFLPATTTVILGEPALAARATRGDFLRRTGADSMSLDTRERVG